MKDNVTRCEFDSYKKSKSKLARKKRFIRFVAILCAVLMVSTFIFYIISYLM